MLHKRLLIYGFGGMLVIFTLANIWPYVLKARANDWVKLEVLKVTTEDGSQVDFVSKSSTVGRDLARDLAGALGVRNEEIAETEETYYAEVRLISSAPTELQFLEAEYSIFIDGIETAAGSFSRNAPLTLPAKGRTHLLLPFTLSIPPTRFSKLIEGNIRARVIGWAWLPRSDHKIRVDFEREISLAQFDL